MCKRSFHLTSNLVWVLGVINSEGPHWEEVRNFTRRQLRDFGFGKNTMQESIMTEVNEFIELIEDAKSEPVKNLKDRLVVAVVNSLWFIATGNRHKQNDAEIIAIAKTGEKYGIKPDFKRIHILIFYCSLTFFETSDFFLCTQDIQRISGKWGSITVSAWVFEIVSKDFWIQ